MGLIIFPLHLIELSLERIILLVEYFRKIMGDINVKVSPMQLIDQVIF